MLDLDRGERAAVREMQGLGEGEVAADLLDRLDRLGEGEGLPSGWDRRVTAGDGLEDGQHERGGAQLEIGRDLEAVRVADDDVQAAEPVRVGVRFVTRVDDGSAQGRLEPDLGLDVVGALGELEPGLLPRRSQTHPAGAGEHLAGDEEGREVADDVVERDDAIDQVVLVGAVAGALAVDVVLVEAHVGGVWAGGEGAHGREHDLLTGAVPQDGVARVGHLRAGVLGVGVVDVEAGTVGEQHVRGGGVLTVEGDGPAAAHDGEERGVVAGLGGGGRGRGAGGCGAGGRGAGLGGVGSTGLVGELARVRAGAVEPPAASVGERVLALVGSTGCGRAAREPGRTPRRRAPTAPSGSAASPRRGCRTPSRYP